MRRISRKADSFTESVIREMNRLAVAAGAVSLAQGFPDFPAPAELKEAAAAALHDDFNQYAITWGARPLREAIAAKAAHFHPGWDIDPETQITVTCGATQGMIAAMLGLLDPGDEVIVFEPCSRSEPSHSETAPVAVSPARRRRPRASGVVNSR